MQPASFFHCVPALFCRWHGWLACGRALVFHSVNSLLPGGCAAAPSIPLRGGFLLPRGLRAVARWAIEAAAPTRLRLRPSRHSPAVRPLAVPLPRTRRSVGSSVSSPRSGALGARTLRRHGSRPPAGRISPPPSRSRCSCIVGAGHVGPAASRARPSTRRVGASNPPSGCQRPWLPRPRGPERRTGTGVSATASHAEGQRGAPAGTCCWVADEGVSERGERGRASEEGPRTRGAKQKPSRSEEDET